VDSEVKCVIYNL